MKQKSNFPIFAIVIAISLGAGFYFATMQNKIMEEVKFPELFTHLSPAKAIKDFSLVDYKNSSFNKSNFSGKWSLVFFGYTSCPDICPTTMQVLANSYEKLTALKSDYPTQVVFVSVDPGRDKPQDKPEKLKDYVSFFHQDFIGITGAHQKLLELTKQLGAAFELKISPAENKYEVAHTPIIFIINPEAKFNGFIRPPHTPEIILQTMKSLIENG